MDGAIETTPLFRLKFLIWVHAAIGAGLLLGLPALAYATSRREPAIGILPGLFIWGLGYRPLQERAHRLAPEDRREARGLPSEIPLAIGFCASMSPFWMASPFCGWIAAAWIFTAATIALRWGISRSLTIPVEKKTWSAILIALCAPLIFLLVIYLILLEAAGC